MFQTILYPTDFSDVAQKALGYIDQFKPAGTKKVVIVHIIDSRTMDLLVYAPTSYMAIEKDLREEAQSKIELIGKHLEKSGFSVSVRVEVGIPSNKILMLEEEENASLIVLGSHGKSNLKEMFLGSVSESVIRAARNPVLVVKR
ncbi:MAG: universal stress protein [Deltaproteobacteria bacterium]|jgi:nucleotide-binding universal stress UspA family protein|nr:universal stress protein [Deltaproteobacteria bacterium]MDX9761026.1 universal stress protein [Desulfomonilia bacterium]HPW68230.1 universal stress protein [Deltaproteobacteria bacterium]